MLYTEQTVRENLRTREGKRVFYLGKGDQLTAAARDYLRGQHIEILPAEQAKPEHYVTENGAIFQEKPEFMTHLHSNVLVPKTHPRIAFRGAMDTLEAELLLCRMAVPSPIREQVDEVLGYARELLRCEVLGEPVRERTVCGLSADEIRKRSHLPQEYYGQPHFMPSAADGEAILRLNRARTAARAVELAAVQAFLDADGVPRRTDLLTALNRLSSILYLFMIRLKAGEKHGKTG